MNFNNFKEFIKKVKDKLTGSSKQDREQTNEQSSSKNNEDRRKNRLSYMLDGMLFIFVLSFAVSTMHSTENSALISVPYSYFTELVDNGQVTVVYYKIDGPTINFKADNMEKQEVKDVIRENIGGLTEDEEADIETFLESKEFDKIFESGKFATSNPRKEGFKESLLLKNIRVTEISDSQGIALGLLLNILPTIIFLVIFFKIAKRAMPNTDAHITASNDKVTFKDIAGYSETKKNMQFLIDILTDTERVSKFNADIPKGVLLYGPAGTGKTLLAKAVATEAGVPFYSMSASSFIEVYAGVGAKRVRELYAKARKHPRAVVFIDEIDAIGAARTGHGGDSEREQTINALLTELDGISADPLKCIITIAATNRLEHLDTALIRSRRFDRKIAVPLPTKVEREEILRLCLEGKPLSDDVDIKALAMQTNGFSGADLKTLINEAALIAIMRKSEFIALSDIDEAFFKIAMMGEKKKLENKKDLEIVAWHEAGHAVVSKLMCGKVIPKVTIIGSTSGAGGVTFIDDADETVFKTKATLKKDIVTLYAGRVAEQLYAKKSEDITTGAANDIERATKLLKQYFLTFGMSSKALLNYSLLENEISDKMIEQIEQLSSSLHSECYAFLSLHYLELKKVAETLIQKESLTDPELCELLNLNQKSMGQPEEPEEQPEELEEQPEELEGQPELTSDELSDSAEETEPDFTTLNLDDYSTEFDKNTL